MAPITLSASSSPLSSLQGARRIALRVPESFGGASGAFLAPSAPAHTLCGGLSRDRLPGILGTARRLASGGETGNAAPPYARRLSTQST